MTGMPASIALVATSVRAAPSLGSSTMASTLLLMKVSTAAICALTSLVPSATCRSTSGKLAAAARAPELMAPSQPWSAAGPEKPIVTVSPVAAFSSVVVPWSTMFSASSFEPVQPASRVTDASTATPVRTRRERDFSCERMYFLLEM